MTTGTTTVSTHTKAIDIIKIQLATTDDMHRFIDMIMLEGDK